MRLGPGLGPIALQRGVLGGVEQPHADTGMPAAQLSRPEGVVGEEEVEDRMPDPLATTRQMRIEIDVDPGRVRAGASLPLRPAVVFTARQ